jgi:nucleoid-associated protein YgaU
MPWRIDVRLLLDASLKGETASIKEDALKLLRMMESKGGGGGGSAPPFVTFKWGAIESPRMVGSSLRIQFVMFRPNGEPSRALVDLELTQAEPTQQGQNPTTRAVAGVKVHRVSDGDSLPSLAYANYGDATRWRPIAEANGIDDPLMLRRGRDLTIPRLDS